MSRGSRLWFARWKRQENWQKRDMRAFLGVWIALGCIVLFLTNSLWGYLSDSAILTSVYRKLFMRSQTSSVSNDTNITASYHGFTADTFISQGYFLVYYFYIPANYNPARKYPLVVVLQGGGERSKTSNTFAQNEKLLLNNPYASVWGDDYNAPGNPHIQQNWPSFVVIPQIESSQQWVNVNLHNGSYAQPAQPSVPLMQTRALLDFLQGKYTGIDPHRLYITGLSNGGLGTWDAIERWPDYFAAAAPIAGAGDPSKAAILKDLPIWAFHGSADTTIPVSGSRDMIAAIQKAGGHPRYTEFAGQGHGVWSYVYSLNASSLRVPDFFSWLFAQRN